MLRPKGGEPWGLSAPPQGGRALGTSRCLKGLVFPFNLSWALPVVFLLFLFRSYLAFVALCDFYARDAFRSLYYP